MYVTFVKHSVISRTPIPFDPSYPYYKDNPFMAKSNFSYFSSLRNLP